MDAAIRLVAGAGLRGLTHRAVDAAAGLAEGSTSAYFRTRAALVSALVSRLDERIGADVDELAKETARHPGDAGHAMEHTMKLLDRWLSDPAPLAARLELSIEATRRPELGEIMTVWRCAFEGLVAQILTDVGLGKAEERAALLVACIDGILLCGLTSVQVSPDDATVLTLAPDVRAKVVEQARTLLSALLVSAYCVDNGVTLPPTVGGL